MIIISILLWGCSPYSLEVVPRPKPRYLISQEALSIHMIDVNQGDPLLIVSPQNKTILIDTGSRQYVEKLIDYLKTNNISVIDIILIKSSLIA